MKRSFEVAGVNVQQPWARLILDCKKTVETRFYPLPEKHVGKQLALIETPGGDGKFSARIVGLVSFGQSFRYANKTQFKKDFKRHLVDETGDFSWKEDKAKWGWPVLSVITLKSALPAPKPRGIVFCSSCTIPTKLLSVSAVALLVQTALTSEAKQLDL